MGDKFRNCWKVKIYSSSRCFCLKNASSQPTCTNLWKPRTKSLSHLFWVPWMWTQSQSFTRIISISSSPMRTRKITVIVGRPSTKDWQLPLSLDCSKSARIRLRKTLCMAEGMLEMSRWWASIRTMIRRVILSFSRIIAVRSLRVSTIRVLLW